MGCKVLRGSAAMLAFCAALAAGGAAQAADAKGNFALRGVGAQSCKTLIEQMQKDQTLVPVVTTWLLGYATAVNRVSPDTYDISPIVDGVALLRIVVGACQTSPDSGFETATAEVLKALSAARVRSDSPIVEVKVGETTVQVRQETLKAVQQALVGRKYLNATPDGIFGPRTETALRAFQKDQKLPENGLPDTATIIRLLVQLPASGQ